MKLLRASWKYYHAEAQCELALLGLASKLCVLSSLECSVDFSNIEAIYRSLVALDNGLAAWPATLSERYAFCRIDSGSSKSLDYYDVYDCHVAAVIWNRYRRIRIQTNERILHYAQLLTRPGQEIDNERAYSQWRAISTMSKLSEDICYSVPFFLNKGVSTGRGIDTVCDEMTVHGGTSVIVPLSLAANEERVSPSMYRWMVSQIERIENDTGISMGRQ